MSWTWNPWALPAILSGVTSIALALVVLLGGRPRLQERSLALFLLVNGIAPLAGGGLMYSTTSASDAYAYQIVALVTFTFAAPALLFFLSTLPGPGARLLRGTGVRAGILAATGGVLAWILLDTPAFLTGVESTWYTAQEAAWGPAATVQYLIVWPLLHLGALMVCLAALRSRDTGELTRERTRLLATVFGLFLAWEVVATPTLVLVGGPTEPRALDIVTLLGYPIATVAFTAGLAYGILRYQLFDIDLKIKWTISRGTVAAVFVVVVLVATEGAQVLLGSSNPWFGIAAAALLVFALAPLQRLGERVSDTALPRVRDTEEYRLVRKHAVYRAAIESALSDGEITGKERSMLATLADELGLTSRDALALERDAEAALGGAAP